MKQFAAIILAAGKAERFGSPKCLLDWDGKTLIQHIVEEVIALNLNPVIVVLGATIEPVTALLEEGAVELVVNRDYELGMGTSFSAGVEAIKTNVDGVFVFLGDHPFVDSKVVDAILERSSEGDVVFPVYKDVPGHPVLWNRVTFEQILQLEPGETGKNLQKQFKCIKISWPSEKIILDIDTQYDYKEMSKKFLDSGI